ncbi:MAG: hypothetical protein QGG26_16010 [Candidatus Undinarchaeales archaeon]|nr:hypothetical protein [Candidatus Undinarchaeales archaeon]
MDHGRCARGIAAVLLLLVVSALGADGPCVTIADVSVERTDIWAYQVDMLTVALENECGGQREVEVLANPSGRFTILGEHTVRLVLEERRELVFTFYPRGGTAALTHLPVVVTDRTGGDERMAGAKAELYVANPLAQLWYTAAVLFLGAAYLRRGWLREQLELSPLPLAVGIWLVHRGHLLATRGALAGATDVTNGIVVVELVGLGLLLVAFGRTVSRTARAHPLTLVIAVYILARTIPPDAYIPPDMVRAWDARSLVPLREEALFVLALPLYILGEASRLHVFHGLHPVAVLVVAALPTVVYWRTLARAWHGLRRAEAGTVL